MGEPSLGSEGGRLIDGRGVMGEVAVSAIEIFWPLVHAFRARIGGGGGGGFFLIAPSSCD